jgi:hypothetical protein
MTAVGKILVFMNFLFSLAVAGLIILVFRTSTNWKLEYDKVKNLALVSEAAYKTEKIQHENDIKGRDAQIATIVSERKAYEDSVKAEITKYKQLTAQNTLRLNENTLNAANLATLSAEVQALKDERATLTKDADLARAKVLDVQKETNDQRLLTVANRIEADNYRAKSERLMTRLEELERSHTNLQNKLNAMGSGGGDRNSILNPPPIPAPRDVKATVRAVGTNGQIVINIGSDSGISPGNKLVVYRIDSLNPKNSVYLGELVIGAVEPKQAVGQFYPKPYAKPEERLPKVDDIVSTTLGSRP